MVINQSVVLGEFGKRRRAHEFYFCREKFFQIADLGQLEKWKFELIEVVFQRWLEKYISEVS